jgi:hypothetical protein
MRSEEALEPCEDILRSSGHVFRTAERQHPVHGPGDFEAGIPIPKGWSVGVVGPNP